MLFAVIVIVTWLPSTLGGSCTGCNKQLNACKNDLKQCENKGGVQSCPPNFTYNKDLGSCYNFVTRRQLTWFNCLTVCIAMGANLVAIETQEEFDFIHSEIKRKGMKSPGESADSFFTGGTSINGHWEWIGGASFATQPMSFAPWRGVQGTSGSQLCHVLWAPDFYRWHDHPCSFEQNFICEIKLVN
ncbi:unnamed protein product [Owenia fusiformis]|uniref:Uncharacterized protein n=1 Tax=Owenia fusiformis TaxID=6347 RepID=A0A8J1TSP3_OWEFU|nr:unnamed protein product [Owenia fusiformis]